MLSSELQTALNKQINVEFESSNLYLQMSAWADKSGYPGCAAFLRTHADEEMMHMRKMFGFVIERNGLPTLETIEAPRSEYNDLGDVFQYIQEHELMVTQRINELAMLAFETKDMISFNFLQWYVSEQLEEESLINGILDKLALLEGDKKGLYLFDRELNEMAAAESTANTE